MKFYKNIWGLGFFLCLVFFENSPSLLAQGVSSTIGGIESNPTHLSPSSIFWNPAVIGASSKTEIETNIALMGGWLIYDRSGTDPNTGQAFNSSSTSVLTPNPFVSVVSPLGTKHFRSAYSTYFPNGALAHFNPNGSQRYDLISGVFIPWNHQFTLAYTPNEHWAFATSFIYSLAFFKTELDVDMGALFGKILKTNEISRENPSLSSRVRIPMTTASSFGGAFGLFYGPNIQWSFGLSFYLPMTYSFDSEISLSRPSFFRTIGVASDGLGIQNTNNVRTNIEIENPAVLNFGFRYQPFGYWTGEYFGQYIFASLTHFTTIHFLSSPIAEIDNKTMLGEKPQDNYLVGSTQSFTIWRPFQLGLSSTYHWNGVSDELLSPSRVDFDTLNVGLFGRYHWTKSLTLGAEYSHSFMFERKVKESKSTTDGEISIISPTSSAGSYRAGLDRAALNLTYEF